MILFNFMLDFPGDQVGDWFILLQQGSDMGGGDIE